MHSMTLCVRLVLVLSVCFASTRLQGQDTPPGSEAETRPAKPAAETRKSKNPQFTRFVEVDEKSGHFDTAIAVYENDQGYRVDLIGAVHIGDLNYYEKLQEEFTRYDAVLYELVAPKNTVPEAGAPAKGMISALQRSMKTALKLEFQLDAIDYTAENFIHADMDPEEFARLQSERGESIWSFMLDMMYQAMKNPEAFEGKTMDLADVVKSLFSKDGNTRLKILLAKQLDGIEEMMSSFGKGSVILHERNRVAMEVLDEVIKQTPEKKTLGIFYGAAHLPDLEKRLLERGFKKKDTRWITAWQIGPKPKKL